MRTRASGRRAGRALGLGLLACALLPAAPAAAGRIDGISDQGLPAWDGSFATSAFAREFRRVWAGGPVSGIALARYVAQWDLAGEVTRGPDPQGDYRERFEAWLADVRTLGLTPVVALTSFDGVRPDGVEEYRAALGALLADAAADGQPVAFVEPWNEPNGQGAESAPEAAVQADAAERVCSHEQRCEVIAGGLEDAPGSVSFERSYERGLRFRPLIWGVHPYRSVASRSDGMVVRLRRALPAAGSASELWLTEVAALYCAHGLVRGEGEQALDAEYLAHVLASDPRLDAAHVFYYGFMAGDRRPARCDGGNGEDGELYGADGRPRPAASIVLRSALGSSGDAFGPVPGEQRGALTWAARP